MDPTQSLAGGGNAVEFDQKTTPTGHDATGEGCENTVKSDSKSDLEWESESPVNVTATASPDSSQIKSLSNSKHTPAALEHQILTSSNTTSPSSLGRGVSSPGSRESNQHSDMTSIRQKMRHLCRLRHDVAKAQKETQEQFQNVFPDSDSSEDPPASQNTDAGSDGQERLQNSTEPQGLPLPNSGSPRSLSSLLMHARCREIVDLANSIRRSQQLIRTTTEELKKKIAKRVSQRMVLNMVSDTLLPLCFHARQASLSSREF